MTTPSDKYLDGKPTITPDDHADNFGQREDRDHEGTKQTIAPDNHASNFGQRCGYHDDDRRTEERGVEQRH